jgi:hypothetical protein
MLFEVNPFGILAQHVSVMETGQIFIKLDPQVNSWD